MSRDREQPVPPTRGSERVGADVGGGGGALAVIIARGGSKGLPRKNALPVAGRPCIEWTLGDACDAETVGPIVLSTDDAELMTIGRAWGDRTGARVRVVERSAELASDTATVDAAVRSAVTTLEGSGPPSQREGVGGRARATGDVRMSRDEQSQLTLSHLIVILYGNVPVRPSGLIDRAVRMLVETGADSVQSYAPVGKFHPWWMARVDRESGAVRPWEGDVLNHGVFRRQDLPPVYVPDGGVIVVRREALMLETAGVAPGPHAFFGREDRRRGVINREGDVIDIDSRIDLMVADATLQDRSEPRPSESGVGTSGAQGRHA